jgi:hypothetical protein
MSRHSTAQRSAWIWMRLDLDAAGFSADTSDGMPLI